MDFFARLNQISLHRSTDFFAVTKLNSPEPTWGQRGNLGPRWFRSQHRQVPCGRASASGLGTLTSDNADDDADENADHDADDEAVSTGKQE